jgi:hypothetical protein
VPDHLAGEVRRIGLRYRWSRLGPGHCGQTENEWDDNAARAAVSA